MSCKKLINIVDKCVDESLAGLVAVNTGLELLEGYRVVLRADLDGIVQQGKVTLVCGGGAGHEPAHAGYVGPGMLTAAVSGAVFTSPPPSSILAALRLTARAAGSLVIVTNYTGDRLNFGKAVELARAEGCRCQVVVVADDCALVSADKSAGRRGLAGTVFVQKIAGALAEEGADLGTVAAHARQAAADMTTIGLSLSPCSVPGAGPSFTLREDEVELGLGIHGEAGVRRTQMLSAKETVELMFAHMTNPESATKFEVSSESELALLVNNLGGTSVLEMNIICKEAIEWLGGKGAKVSRVYCGTFMTSLEMQGISLTVLRLNDLRKRCLDATTSAPGWRPSLTMPSRPHKAACRPAPESDAATVLKGKEVSEKSAVMLRRALTFLTEALISCEEQLNRLDREAGDGDCGTTHRRAAEAIQGRLEALPLRCPAALMTSLSQIIESSMGGSSGAIYSLFFTAAAASLENDVSAAAWCDALGKGLAAVCQYGGAEPGDRTMVDALHPAHQALTTSLQTGPGLQAFESATSAAEQGAASTARLTARAGRASYVRAEKVTLPDPGAHAVGIWMRAAYEACKLSRDS